MSGIAAAVAVATEARTGLRSSKRLTVLDQYRVPYDVNPALAAAGIEQLRTASGGPRLFWPMKASGPAVVASLPGADGSTPIPVFCRVLPDHALEPLLESLDSGWERRRVLTNDAGGALGSIWMSKEGSVFLPLDPDEVFHNYVSEQYLTIAGRVGSHTLRRALMMTYYGLRPLIPRRGQIWLRRHFARMQAWSRFPRWPAETCLDDFTELLFAILTSITDGPLPSIASWPADYTWALVLTHDIELASGWAAREPVVELERAYGVRSSWNLVARDYELDPESVEAMRADGFEIGVHGVYHDGRDLASAAHWRARLPVIHAVAERWHAVGFRAPAMHRRWEWMPLLGLEYDSSYPDCDPFQPQPGGCCTWLPFFNDRLVELPTTLAQDHTLFVLLGEQDETIWATKADLLRSRGGMALINTHPDYLTDKRIFEAYDRFLGAFVTDPTAWKPLPREVSKWWRARAASSLQQREHGWEVVGPASDQARIEFRGGSW